MSKSSEDYQRHLVLQAQSGLSKSAYCKQAGIPYQSFLYHWKKQSSKSLYQYVYGNNGNGSNLKTLFDELYEIDNGFRDCGSTTNDFLTKLYMDQPNKLIELLVAIPDIRDVFYFQTGQTKFDCTANLPHDDMAILMSNNYPEISWNHLINAFGTNTILSYFVNNQNSYFMNQGVFYNKSILTNTQQNQNLYGGNYGGLENYFTYIRNYFGQGLYDQLTAGFMQQSSVYTDSLRLEEWHMYGSSRIGIYQTNKAMAQRTVRIENGVTTQLSNTHIEQLSLSRFYTERGAKRYELTNHLGNVLTVVTDKKLPVCSGTSVSYYIADVVSATDYSPFGAPLAGRTWQGAEYRYGFNTQERDDEIAGPGNIMTAEYWEYDTRLGRRWNLDPIDHVVSLYSCLGNSPILFSDPNGDDWIIDKQVKNGKTRYNFTLNASLINKSGAKIDMMKLRENIVSDLKSTLAKENIEEADNISINITINLRNVSNESEIKDNEHVIAVYGEDEFKEITKTNGGVRGVAFIGGMNIAVPLSTATSVILNENHRTIPHELLIHTLGMNHPDEDDGALDAGLVNQFITNHDDNLAWGTPKNNNTALGNKLTGRQIDRMYQNYINNKINKQTQFVNKLIWVKLPTMYPLPIYFPVSIRTNELSKDFD